MWDTKRYCHIESYTASCDGKIIAEKLTTSWTLYIQETNNNKTNNAANWRKIQNKSETKKNCDFFQLQNDFYFKDPKNFKFTCSYPQATPKLPASMIVWMTYIVPQGKGFGTSVFSLLWNILN